MDQLWAPWRMPYIEKGDSEPGCLFCRKIAANEDEQNFIVYRGTQCFVMLNLYPYNSGHLMVAPYQHVGTLPGVEPRVGSDLFAVTQLATAALQEVMAPDAFNFGINQGKVAGAGVADHIHLHVVPRWNGDTNFMPVLADAKVMPELLANTARKLRPFFAEHAPRP
ncbi:MAG: HIT family protein [Chloroflexota bacterium]